MTEQTRGKKLRLDKAPMPERPPPERAKCFEEVNCGYNLEMAKLEAERCLFCKKPLCIQGCPVAIDIPRFIKGIVEGDLLGSYKVLRASNPLPAVCGRVCPQETQCEEKCVIGKKGAAVAIGHLERFVGDWAIEHKVREQPAILNQAQGAVEGEAPSGFARGGGDASPYKAKKAAIIGSGPAGISCANDLARAGFDVTIFEALHEAGGVLSYGIPPFRLSRKVIQEELDGLVRMGVKIELNRVIGKVFTIKDLMQKKGFDAVFIGTGAGLPKFMGIPGEHLNGVMSANEFLTRVNLMDGFQRADTPVGMGSHVTVIGAGNTALDSARTALRMGAKEVSIVYRRTEKESPARVEELRHAKEEGVVFRWLTNPVRHLGDENGQVREMECIQMELGEPDASGRRSPKPVPGSEFRIKSDTVIYGLGTVTNPIIAQSTPDLKTNKWGYIEADPETQMTSIPGVFAGGDIVTGAATVILALGAGRRAARGILKYLGLSKEQEQTATGGTRETLGARSEASGDKSFPKVTGPVAGG